MLLVNMPVMFAHIDCDWYESVLISLQRIEPKLIKGGVMIIDDYYTWEGCRRAVDDYFSDKKNRFEFYNKKRLHIMRKELKVKKEIFSNFFKK
jgi:asparagine synthase (glutamine-hydrolysing)